MIKKLCFVTIFLAVLSASGCAAQFKLADPAQGTVTYKGVIIIAKEGFVIGPEGPSSLQLLQADSHHIFTPESKTWEGNIAQGETNSEHFPWAREVAMKDDVAEVTTAVFVPPALRDMNMWNAYFKYYIPVSTLKGAKLTGHYGDQRPSYKESEAIKTVTLTGVEKEGATIISRISQFSFSGGAVDFTLDLSPTGPWRLFDEDPTGSPVSFGDLTRKGDYYVIRKFSWGAAWGTKLLHKLVVHPGAINYQELHPINTVQYTWRMPDTWRIQFTSKKPLTGFTHDDRPGYSNFITAGAQTYSPKAGMGWQRTPSGGVKDATQDGTLGPLYGGGFAGRGDATFLVDQRNAMVLVNVLLSGADGASEVKVRCNGNDWTDVTIPAGQRRNLIVPLYVKNGKIAIDIKGTSWMFSGIIIQPLFFESEDYLFSRCWWAFGKAPWEWPSFSHKEQWKDWPVGMFGPKPLSYKPVITQ